MSEVSDQQDGLLTEYETAATAYLLMAMSIDSLGRRNKQLEDENAKLRGLMSVMAYCNQFRRDCDGCSMNGAAGIITERAGCDELLARLREMGVEVPA